MATDKDIAAIAADMSEDLGTNNGLRDGLSIIESNRAVPYRPGNRFTHQEPQYEEAPMNQVFGPYSIPEQFKTKHKPPAVVLENKAKASQVIPKIVPAPAAPKPPAPSSPEHRPIVGMVDRQIEL